MEDKLRKLQLTQLEMLKVFDSFCRKNSLKYSLYAGTLLGAVRHSGFIPWDDDLDVCMSRADYNRFIRLWNEAPVKGYILQNKENSPAFTQSFTKIRKEGTTFLSSEREAGKYHNGIFIDIFPIDRIPNGKLKQAVFKWRCMRYQLITREYLPPEGNAIVRLVSSLVLMTTPESKRAKVRQKLLCRITKYNDMHDCSTVAIERKVTWGVPLGTDLLDNYVELQYEDDKFMCFAEWENYLTQKFGDYMQLPPEDERGWQHHPIILDFNHSYEELEALK